MQKGVDMAFKGILAKKVRDHLGPIQITEYAYNQVKEKIKDLTV